MKKTLFTILVIFLTGIFVTNGQEFIRQNPESLPGKEVNFEIKGQEQTSNRVDPFLRFTMIKVTQLKKSGSLFESDLEILNNNIRVNKNILSEISVPVFIKSNNVDATSSTITARGGIIYSVIKDIITAEIPISFTEELSLQSHIIYIQGSYVNQPLIDVSRVETKVDQLHNGNGIPRPYKGKDVIVGVVDSGIDWKHPDFKTASGNRILYLWDMSGQGNPPAGYNYGTEYTKANLDANQCSQVDGNDGGGHGTHVTGTAAGNGRANTQYIGMAPESDIVFVKGFRNGPGFADSDVVNGCNYIFQKADQLQKPAVINLSLGGHFGPHDGSSLYEQALSNLTGNGKIIVAAGGNSGGENIHLSYSTSGSSYNDSYETIWLVPENASAAYIDLWYDTGNISVGIAAYDPVTQDLIGFTNPVAPGQQVQGQPFTVNGVTYGWFTIDATNTNDPNNNSREVFIALESNNGSVNLGSVYWSLYTFGSGTFDAWNLGGEFSTYSNDWFKPGDNNKTIGTPGTAQKIVCIGSYVTKTSWVDFSGTTQFQPGNPVNGKISGFSSLGPTRDNRLKPDIVAPGEVIIAALSSDYTQVPSQWVLLGGQLQKAQGTSMAAPHVTGSIALLLEKNSSLNYDDVVNVLKNTAVRDGFTSSSPNNTYGYGKLDSYNAFQNVSGGGGGGTQVTIIQEGFDHTFPPNGWQIDVSNQSFTWQQGNVTNQNFNQIDPNSVNSAFCPWVNQNQNEWLITPSFNLGNGNATVEFYIGYSTAWLSNATINLKISTNNGSSWTDLWSAENDGQGWMWRQKTVDLTAYSNNSNLKLAWQYIGNDGDIVALDGVKLVGFQQATSVQEITSVLIPSEFQIYQNYPNPFNPITKIKFDLPLTSDVSLKIYDILGKEIATLINEEKSAGRYEVNFEAADLSSGVYFYKIKAGDYNQIRKMILLK